MLGVRRVTIVAPTNVLLVTALLAVVLVVIPVILLLVVVVLVVVVLLGTILVRILALLAARLMVASPSIIGSGSSIPEGPVTLRMVCVSMALYRIGLSPVVELATYQTVLSISTRPRGQAISVVACSIIRSRGVCGLCGHRLVSILALFIPTAPIPLIPEAMGAINPRGVDTLVTHDGAGVDRNIWNRGLGSPAVLQSHFLLSLLGSTG